MKEYTIFYTLKNDRTEYVGSAYGADETEAAEYFDIFHRGEDYEIEKVQIYK